MLRRFTTAACTALLVATPAVAIAATAPGAGNPEAAQLSEAVSPEEAGEHASERAGDVNANATTAQSVEGGTQLANVPYDGRGIDTSNRASVVEGYVSTFGRFKDRVARVTGEDLGNCVAGTTNPEDIRIYVAMWNYQRALAGLGMLEPLTSGPYQESVQEAAMIMAANRRLSHYPQDDGFRCVSAKGAEGATSNLYLGERTIGGVAGGFADDPEEKNEIVGHRLNLLRPTIKQGTVGFSEGGYAAVQRVHEMNGDESPGTLHGTDVPIPEFIAWPSPGYFPAPLYPATDADKWSFSVKGVEPWWRPDVSKARITITTANGYVVPILKQLDSTTGGPWTIRAGDEFYGTIVFHTPANYNWKFLAGQDAPVHVRIDGIQGAPKSTYEYDVILVNPTAIVKQANSFWSVMYPDPAREPVLIDACQLTNTCQYFLTNGWEGNATSSFTFGDTRAPLLVGDWDGDGVDSVAIRRGNILSARNGVNPGPAQINVAYGRATDDMIVGDWDGDGVDTLAARRGNLFLFTDTLGGGNADFTMHFGRVGDQILVGDWDGDGKDTIGLRRGNVFYLSNEMSGGNAEIEFNYGRASDEIMVGDWDGDESDTIVIRRGNLWYFRNTLSTGIADLVTPYGRAGDQAFVGDWDGDGSDTPGVRRD